MHASWQTDSLCGIGKVILMVSLKVSIFKQWYQLHCGHIWSAEVVS